MQTQKHMHINSALVQYNAAVSCMFITGVRRYREHVVQETYGASWHERQKTHTHTPMRLKPLPHTHTHTQTQEKTTQADLSDLMRAERLQNDTAVKPHHPPSSTACLPFFSLGILIFDLIHNVQQLSWVSMNSLSFWVTHIKPQTGNHPQLKEYFIIKLLQSQA